MYTSRYERIEQALRMILEIGKRDMSNPKYDGYFKEAKEALARPETQTLCERITDYLEAGGLFNPELANHNQVRDLLFDCRDALATGLSAGPQLTEEQAREGDEVLLRVKVAEATKSGLVVLLPSVSSPNERHFFYFREKRFCPAGRS